MVSSGRFRLPWRPVMIAGLLALSLLLFFPGKSEAHADLLRSDPASNAVLPVAPDQVHLWFSEQFNPALSTAVVVNEASTHADIGDAHVSPDDPTEMEVDLKPNLPATVYTVVYRTDSSDDGHVLTGSFLFTVARADGSIPTLSPGANPGANVLGTTSLNGQYTGQLDGPTALNLLVITLVELAAVFYAGASIWQLFVLQPASEEHAAEEERNQQTQQRFERRLALPTLLILLLANTGVLIGQALAVTSGNWGAAFAPSLLVPLLTSGRFGVFWLVREVLILLELQLAFYQARERWRSARTNAMLLWANVILSMALFLAMALSSHAAAAPSDKVLFALIADWLHLVAAALWVGGICYLATSYLPVLRRQASPVQARALTTILPYYTPWALAGVILMAVTGPFSATVQLRAWEQLFSTAYGRALVIKGLLVGGMLLASAVHVFVLRPRLQREYRKYTTTVARLQVEEKVPAGVQGSSGTLEVQDTIPASRRRFAREVRLRERRVTGRTRFLSRLLRWEAVMGVAVLVCVGLMNVFAGTLSPITPAQPAPSASGPSQALHASARTSDGLFTVILQISPDQVGSNAFLATVQEAAGGKTVTNVDISLSLSDLDMDMGTQTIRLQADGKGHFSGLGNLLMSGHWQIHFQIQTRDTRLHEGSIKVQAS